MIDQFEQIGLQEDKVYIWQDFLAELGRAAKDCFKIARMPFPTQIEFAEKGARECTIEQTKIVDDWQFKGLVFMHSEFTDNAYKIEIFPSKLERLTHPY